MTRTILAFSLATAFAVLALGCGGSSKQATPPKDPIPLIKDGPKAGVSGQPAAGQQGGNRAALPSGTAQ